MCGIIGTLTFNKNGFFLRDVEVFKELLIVNSIRGSHSTGVFGGTLTSEMDFAKVVGNPYDFINNKQTEPIFNNMLNKYRLMVGHGRQATRGSITGEFAHPFQKDHITMVHNGTVNNSSLIDVTKYVSDSKAICEALSKNNEQEVFQDINGAYAIAYHNSKKETFSLVRNKERPLALGIDENNNRIYFSSEINLLETILLRNSIAGVVLSSIPENTIFTFNTKGGINYTETKTKPPITLVQVPTSYTQSYNSSSNARVVSITSHSTGEKIKLGDKVIFSISDIHELRSDNKNDDKFFQVFGYIPSFPEIETSVLYLGKEEELYENTNWEATVASFSPASNKLKAKGIEWFVYMSNIAISDNVTLGDGVFMKKSMFSALTSNGCDCCKDKIDLKDSENTFILDNQVLCSTCYGSFSK